MKEEKNCNTCNYQRVNFRSDPCDVCILYPSFPLFEEKINE